MYLSSKTVSTLQESASDILIPKFRAYVEERKNDPSIVKEINDEIIKIESLEDLIENTLTSKLPNKKKGDSMYIGSYWFHYDEPSDSFKFDGNIEAEAREKVFSRNNFYQIYESVSTINRRIRAIITTLEDIAFPEMIILLESQLNWADFMPTNNSDLIEVKGY